MTPIRERSDQKLWHSQTFSFEEISKNTCQISPPKRIPSAPFVNGSIAQLVEQLTFNQLVLGSSPSRPTNEMLEMEASGAGR
jgi:hypothetical protein